MKNERRTPLYIQSVGKLKQTCSRDNFTHSSFIVEIFFLEEFLALFVITDNALQLFLDISRVFLPSLAHINAEEIILGHSEKCQEKERRTLKLPPRSPDQAGPDSSSPLDESTECFDEATGPTELVLVPPFTWPLSLST